MLVHFMLVLSQIRQTHAATRAGQIARFPKFGGRTSEAERKTRQNRARAQLIAFLPTPTGNLPSPFQNGTAPTGIRGTNTSDGFACWISKIILLKSFICRARAKHGEQHTGS